MKMKPEKGKKGYSNERLNLVANYIVNYRLSKNSLGVKLVKEHSKDFGKNHNPSINTLVES